MSGNSKALELAADTKLAAGVQQYFAPSNVTITVAGVTLTPPEVLAAIQSRTKAGATTESARAAYLMAVAAENATLASTQPTINGLKQIVHVMYANSADILAVFGLSPKKVPAPLTLAQKAERAAKIKATRLARNTMGPKEKAKVKGTVTPAAPAAGTTTPGASATATGAPTATPNGAAHS